MRDEIRKEMVDFIEEKNSPEASNDIDTEKHFIEVHEVETDYDRLIKVMCGDCIHKAVCKIGGTDMNLDLDDILNIGAKYPNLDIKIECNEYNKCK